MLLRHDRRFRQPSQRFHHHPLLLLLLLFSHHASLCLSLWLSLPLAFSLHGKSNTKMPTAFLYVYTWPLELNAGPTHSHGNALRPNFGVAQRRRGPKFPLSLIFHIFSHNLFKNIPGHTSDVCYPQSSILFVHFLIPLSNSYAMCINKPSHIFGSIHT